MKIGDKAEMLALLRAAERSLLGIAADINRLNTELRNVPPMGARSLEIKREVRGLILKADEISDALVQYGVIGPVRSQDGAM